MRAKQLIAPGVFAETDVKALGTDDLGPDDVLIRVLAAGICGSDLPAFAGRKSLTVDERTFAGGRGKPGYPLHEVVGEVVVAPEGMHGVGDRVVGWATNMDGLAEYVITRSREVIVYEESLTPRHAVILQPLACVLHTLEQIGDLRGRSVAVLGQGPIGLLFSHAVKTLGADVVVGVDRVDRSEVSMALGLDQFVHLSSDQWGEGIGTAERPNLIIEAAGHQVGTLSDAVDAVADRGTIYYFGVPDDRIYPVSISQMLRKNLTLMAGCVTSEHRTAALKLADAYLAEHPDLADLLVTHSYSFDECQKAYDAALQPKTGQHKVVLEFETSAPSA